MFKNLIKHSVRSVKRQRSYIIINIVGLSIGIACSLLIAFFVLYELSYDRYNVKKNRIYDIVLNFKISGQEFTEGTTSSPVGPTLLREFPEVEDFMRMRRVFEAKTITFNNQIYSEENILEADSSFFNFFTIPVLTGDPASVLNAPRKAVLSRSMAKTIFGDKNPIDKIVKIGKDTSVYTISGVMEDIPGNSHFKAGIIISMLSDPQSLSPEWGSNNLSTYLLLKANANYKTINEKFPALVAKYVGPELQRFLNVSFDEFLSKGNKYGYSLQKLTDIHLDTSVRQYLSAAGDPKLLRILAAIAFLILLVAAVNFTNLATAQASARAKEVGIKKLGGSTRSMLIAQFLTESVLMSFVSTIFALIIIKIVLPFFNNLLDTSLKLDMSSMGILIPAMIVFSVFTGILAGSYPSFFLSSFSPYKVLKGGKDKTTHKGWLRKVLVILQFTISIFLIVGTLIMYRQIMFMINRDPGFNKDQLLVIENEGALGSKARSFKDVLKTIPGIVNITSSSSIPGNSNNNNGYMLEGKKEETILMWTNFVDYNYLETYGLTLKSGRFFNKEYLADSKACILNESALKKYNIDPEQIRIMGYRDSGKVDYYPIIGVAKDFVFESQRNQIAPYIFRLKPESERYGYITVKISPNNYREVIKQVETNWKEFTGNEPLKYYFVDDAMKLIYLKDRQNALIAVIASVLAIFIAALGLFGLTSFTVEQRTKEIGIRKAMGSSVTGIYFGISREIIILVSISALISFPVIYYFSGRWLENFYYRITPGVLTFLAGLIITLGVAVLTITFRVIKAARINPAQSLRYE